MNEDSKQLIADARCAVLRAMHRLGGMATTSALTSATNVRGRLLEKTLESLVVDAWIERDPYTMPRLGGVYKLTRERRRERALADAS